MGKVELLKYDSNRPIRKAQGPTKIFLKVIEEKKQLLLCFAEQEKKRNNRLWKYSAKIMDSGKLATKDLKSLEHLKLATKDLKTNATRKKKKFLTVCSVAILVIIQMSY